MCTLDNIQLEVHEKGHGDARREVDASVTYGPITYASRGSLLVVKVGRSYTIIGVEENNSRLSEQLSRTMEQIPRDGSIACMKACASETSPDWCGSPTSGVATFSPE